MCSSMSRFRVVVAGGPIRDVAVETMTNRLQTLCRTVTHSLRKNPSSEFAENCPMELDNDRNHSRNLGNPATAAKQHSWEAADVHMQSLGTVPELDEHDETCGGDDEDDHDPKVTKHILTTCWTWPTSQRSLTQRRVGMRWRLGCQTMAVAMT